jgi:polysaccharide export outer membrane protein
MRVILALLFLCSLLTPAFAERLKPGDELSITVWQDPKLDRRVIIGPDGQFGFPLAGHIRAGGRTLQAVESILRSRLQKKYTGELDISVTLASVDRDALEEAKPIFYVTGEVLKPGPYRLRPRTTVAQGIAQAGGLGVFAAPQRIQIHRKFKGVDSIFLFDYNAFQSGRIATDDINLRTGDVIIVPERGLFE